jgi:hypothetical protein
LAFVVALVGFLAPAVAPLEATPSEEEKAAHALNARRGDAKTDGADDLPLLLTLGHF